MVRAIGPKGIEASRARAEVPTARMKSEGFADALAAFAKKSDEAERAVREAANAARTRSDYSASELLALQSNVYQFSELVDLSSRFVDRSVGAVKTILQGQ